MSNKLRNPVLGILAIALPVLVLAVSVPTQGQQYQPYPPPRDDAYRPAPPPREDTYRPGPPPGQTYYPPGSKPYSGPGQPYSQPPPYAQPANVPPPGYSESTYSSNEIIQAGHLFFGGVTKGLASVVEYAFQQQGRPNGYILGQDAGAAFVAGLRYGEGTLYTKDAGNQRVYWQGPSIGYDAGGDGSKVMVLVYNLRDPSDIYRRFGGIDGSAYIVGGVGLTFQKNGSLVTAPIRTGIGLRLGANVGYLKYTRAPTWNPF